MAVLLLFVHPLLDLPLLHLRPTDMNVLAPCPFGQNSCTCEFIKGKHLLS